jgi:hypothetical protein
VAGSADAASATVSQRRGTLCDRSTRPSHFSVLGLQFSVFALVAAAVRLP